MKCRPFRRHVRHSRDREPGGPASVDGTLLYIEISLFTYRIVLGPSGHCLSPCHSVLGNIVTEAGPASSGHTKR